MVLAIVRRGVQTDVLEALEQKKKESAQAVLSASEQFQKKCLELEQERVKAQGGFASQASTQTHNLPQQFMSPYKARSVAESAASKSSDEVYLVASSGTSGRERRGW